MTGQQRRLPLLAAVLLLAVLAGATYYNYWREIGDVRRGVGRMLFVSAALHARAAEVWTREQLVELGGASHASSVAALLRTPQGVLPSLPAWLVAMRREGRYDAVLLVRPDCSTVLADPPDRARRWAAECREVVAAGRRPWEPRLSDFHRDAATGTVHLDGVMPILAADSDTAAGFLVILIDLATWRRTVFGGDPAAVPTVAHFVGRLDGNLVRPVEDQAHEQTPLLRLASTVPRGGRGPDDGVREAVDRRGVGVLAALLPLGGTSWVVVSSIEESQVDALVRTHSEMVGVLLIACTVAGAFAVLLMTNRTRQAVARVHAEEALRKTEALLTPLLEVAPTPIHVVDGQHRFVLVNRAWAAGVGLERASVVGRRIGELFGTEDAAEYERNNEKVLSTGEPVRAEETAHLETGVRIYDSVKFAIRDETGRPTAVAGISVDISERRQAEDQARREAANTLALLNIAEQSSVGLDVASILDRVCRETASVLNVPAVSVGLAAEDGLLRNAAGLGLPAKWSDFLGAGSIAEYVRLAGSTEAPLVWPDAQAGPPPFGDLAVRLGIRSFMATLIRRRHEVIGILSVMVTQAPRYFRSDEVQLLSGVANLTAQALTDARLFEETRSQAWRLRTLAGRLSEADERERGRLARDLHDQVGQNLTALGLNINLAKLDASGGRSDSLTERLAVCEALVEGTSRSIRSVLLDLRPPALDDYGLFAALQTVGSQLTAQSSLRVIVSGEDLTPRPRRRVEGFLYRIAQEAVTNAVKHAQASRVTIDLSTTDDRISLVVADDGRGFDMADRTKATQPSWGLLIMQERAQAIGADLHIDTSPGAGTRVVVELRR
jgi:PAS domain S-box-containing protein